MEKKIKLIAVVGPTASGKSGLAVALAQALDGEVVSCDSMQVYEGMEIGTAKITREEMGGIPHHLLGFQPCSQRFSVSDYVPLADAAIAGIAARGHVPILAGGTGLYARSLLYGVQFEENSRDVKLWEALEAEMKSKGQEALYLQLSRLDPVAAERIHPNNQKRLLRALEYCMVTGKHFSEHSVIELDSPKYDFLMLCIGFRDREKLYERINTRVDQMIAAGLLEEAREQYERRDALADINATVLQAIGYKELFPYFEGKLSLPEAVENIKRETRRYAKRQLTWFQKEANITWLYADTFPDSDALYAEALGLCRLFLAGKKEEILNV